MGNALESYNPALAVVIRSVLARIGTDVTDATARRSCVVIAPHPDDETLGAGATIMRKVDAGTAVHVVVATDGSKSPVGDPAAVAALRAAELADAAGVLGLSPADVTRLPFVDAELDRDDDTLVRAIAEVVAAHKPDEVLVTGVTDPHDDHAALGAATRRALAGTGVRLLAYPIWQFERPGRLLEQLRHSGRPELVRTERYRERKARAIASYASQLAASDGAAEGVKPSYLRNFSGAVEMFFPVAPDTAASRASPGGLRT
jgi:LmbE family N-acetylglucosaminyl deacetylase